MTTAACFGARLGNYVTLPVAKETVIHSLNPSGFRRPGNPRLVLLGPRALSWRALGVVTCRAGAHTARQAAKKHVRGASVLPGAAVADHGAHASSSFPLGLFYKQ